MPFKPPKCYVGTFRTACYEATENGNESLPDEENNNNKKTQAAMHAGKDALLIDCRDKKNSWSINQSMINVLHYSPSQFQLLARMCMLSL